MSTWSEYIWGTSSNSGSIATTPAPPAPPQELENLPSYNTYNGLAPHFQVTPEHDPNHIFPEEYDLIEQVRSQIPEAANYPSRYILIFLFARRHSVSHSVKLLSKHFAFLQKMGFPEVTKENPYPFKADQLTDTEKKFAIVEGPVMYKHILIDKHNRLLQYIRTKYWIRGRISVPRYISAIIWWYYYSFQHVPLCIHRNGMAVVVDMRDMGWINMDFSSEIQEFIGTALTTFPGRMRQAWIVNSNWIFNTAWSLIKLVLSGKVLSRMQQVPVEFLVNEIDREYLSLDLGGTWDPDLMREWYDKVFELDMAAGGVGARHSVSVDADAHADAGEVVGDEGGVGAGVGDSNGSGEGGAKED